MVKKFRRHTAADKVQVASEALEGSKTISQCLNDRTPPLKSTACSDGGSPFFAAQCRPHSSRYIVSSPFRGPK